jgi:hypothetical protein
MIMRDHTFIVLYLQATQMEKMAREKETKFALEQKASTRKIELESEIEKLHAKEEEVSSWCFGTDNEFVSPHIFCFSLFEALMRLKLHCSKSSGRRSWKRSDCELV